MKIKMLIWLGFCIQCAFLIFWLLRVPAASEEITIAQDELKKGDADLPALTIRNGGLETTVAYDPSKSACENLMARTKARLTIADGAFASIVRIPLLVGLFNIVLSVVLLRSLRTKKPQREQRC